MNGKVWGTVGILVCCVFIHPDLYGKKIKNTLTIERDTKIIKEGDEFQGKEYHLNDIGNDYDSADSEIVDQLSKISFAGYDKEPNSSMESFLLINPTEKEITGFEVKINYLDMNGRMFHSRVIKEKCEIPTLESRRIDIKSWDKQHTYYYYLGNEPKKVATPFKVEFKPISFWIKDN